MTKQLGRGELASGVVVALVCATAVFAQRADDSAFMKAEETIRTEMSKAGAPGVAVAIVSAERVLWAKGFGLANVETEAPVTPDTLFQVGSVTKTFTAAAVVGAAAAGTVALDRPVSTYVAGLTPCLGRATLAQLLSHTGGVMDEPDEYGSQAEEGLAAYARTWTAEYCLLPPGRAFSYSNSGLALAGLALQEADKTPYADLMRKRIFDPLGMRRTTFRPTEAMTWPLAVGHRRDNAGTFSVVRPLANDARLWPAGTLYSSANELARFATALLNDGKVDGQQALPAGVVATMRKAVIDIPPTSQRYGLGVFLDGDGFGHGGTMTGYTAQITVEPALGAAVVVLTNGANVNPESMAQAALAPLRRSATPAQTVSAPEQPLPSAAAAAFVGTYRNPRRFTVEVVRQGDGLVLKRFNRDFPMKHLGRSQFSVDLPRGGTEIIAFGIGPDGRADYLQMNVWALARVTP